MAANWHMSETQKHCAGQGREFEDVSASDRDLPPPPVHVWNLSKKAYGIEGRRTPAIEQSNQTCIIIQLSSLIMDVLLPSGGNNTPVRK